jgi:HEAT repeat protein
VTAIVGGIAALGLGAAVIPTLLRHTSEPAVAIAAPVDDQVQPAPAPTPPTPAPTQPAPAAAAPKLDAATLLSQALTQLRTYLGDPSPRLRLMAALALARTADTAALAELEKDLADDPSVIRRLDVAYALARAGHTKGTDILVAGLSADRRDVRLQAARWLAALKDDRAKPRLREAMSISFLRLSAAETLATLHDAEALKVLADALAGTDPESRMRAAAALARAGDHTGEKLLLELIAHPRVELGAAEALSHLGRTEAIPALTQALRHTALRVDAALALRRLAAHPSPDDLAPLADVLAQGDERARTTAAEALIILCDPSTPPELR